MHQKLLYCFLFLLCLIGCDTKDSTPLPGTRVPFATLEQGLSVDSSLKHKPIIVPGSEVNDSWQQVGGNLEHAMPPLKIAKKPNLLWQKAIGQGTSSEQRLLANAVVDQGLIFTMDAAGLVVAHNQKSGDEVWQYDTTPAEARDEALGGGVCVSGGKVYATTSFGDVIALTAKDGKLLWKKSLKAPIRVAPTADGKRVYIVTVSNETYVLDAQKGEDLWSHGGIVEPASLLGGASPAVVDDMVISAYSSGEVYAFDAKSGQVLWSETLTPSVRSDTVASIPHIRARPVVFKGRVYVISHGGRMTAINLKTGEKDWQKEIAGTRTPAVVGDYVFMLTSQNEVLCMDKDNGGIKWFVALPMLKDDDDKTPIFWAGPTLANDTLVFSGSNGEIRLLNTVDGKLVHTITAQDNAFFLSPIIVSETLYALADDGQLYAWK